VARQSGECIIQRKRNTKNGECLLHCGGGERQKMQVARAATFTRRESQFSTRAQTPGGFVLHCVAMFFDVFAKE
jgi:hypothetical protein